VAKFIKKATIGIASAVAVGSVFYTFGGVAQTVFPSITPVVMGVIGFGSALAIALAENKK